MNTTTRSLIIVTAVVALVAGVAWMKSARYGAAATNDPRPTTMIDAGRPTTAPSNATDAAATQPAGKLPQLIDLGAGHCVPCKQMAPILEELRKEYAGRAEVVFIDVSKVPDAAEVFGVRTIPTQIFHDREGKEVWRHSGFLSKEAIVAKFRELGVK
jgi:thioredoxin 1